MSHRILGAVPCLAGLFLALFPHGAAGQPPAVAGKLTMKSLKKVLEDGGLVAEEMKNAKGEVTAYRAKATKGTIMYDQIAVFVDLTGEFVYLMAKLGKAGGTPPAGIAAGLLKANDVISPCFFYIDERSEYITMLCPIANADVTPKLLRARMDKLAIHLDKYRDLWDDRVWSIDGEWIGVSANYKGTDDPTFKSARLSVKNNTAETKGEKGADTWKFTLAPEKTPKAIDIITREKTSLGIYQIKGDELTICMAKPGFNRPSEFKSEKDSENFVMVFRRAVKSPLDGEWTVVRDTFPEGKKQQKWVIAGNNIAATRGDRVLNSKFTLRPDKAPNAIDIEAERVFPGIYQLKGDELTICFATKEGDNRPTEFTAEEGGANVLIVLKKAQK